MSIPNNSLLSERLNVLGALSPVALTAGATLTSSYVGLQAANGNLSQRYLGVVSVNSTNTATVQVVKASDTSGTGATAIATYSYATTNGEAVLFDINGVNVDTSKPYIALRVSAAAAAVAVSGIILGGDGRYDPASSYNLTSTTSFTTASTINSV